MTDRRFFRGGYMNNKLSDRAISVFAYAVMVLFALFCAYPLLLTLMISLSDETLVQIHGFRLIPEQFSLATYKYLLEKSSDKIISAYSVTISVTAAGTLLSLVVTSMLAYTMSQKNVKYRNGLALFSYITVIFSAGMIPWYIVCVNVLHINNTFFALILPYCVSIYNLFLLRNYFQSIPDSVVESAKIDGANAFTIYARLVVPLSRTAMLTVGLFYALAYWNDWFLAIMLVSSNKLYPLQYYLYNLLSNVNAISSGKVNESNIKVPSETIKMATTIITIGPILLFYPFVQKYFVKGIIVGAVKG
jgi:putative aldouronate transport system permease protein